MLIVTGTTRVKQRIRNIEERASNPEKALESIGNYMRRQFSKQFTSEGAFLGTPWSPLKPSYAAWKIRHGGGRILVRSGELRDSYVNKTKAYQKITGKEAEYGSNDRKAVWHQYGTTSHHTGKRLIPARKVIVVTPQIREDVKSIIAKYVAGSNNGLASSVPQ